MKVFYTDRQQVTNNASYSPSAGKPARVVASWKKLGIPLEIVIPEPVTVDDLSRAHCRSYVEGVLNLTRDNGFDNRIKEVAESLPWTNGSFVSAAEYAVKTGETVASPTSGFHHARFDDGALFCTFNGLMVAFLKLRNEGYSKKIGILDCDAHEGDGTDDILKTLKRNNVAHARCQQRPVVKTGKKARGDRRS